MGDSRVTFVCSPAKLKELAPSLVGEVSMLQIEPLGEKAAAVSRPSSRVPGTRASDRIEAYIAKHLDQPGFEISREALVHLLTGFGFRSPSASVSHAMASLAKAYGLETLNSSLWRIAAR